MVSIEEEKDREKGEGSQGSNFFDMSLVAYTVLSLIGLGIIIWGQQNFTEIFSIPTSTASSFKIFASAALGIGILLVANQLIESYSSTYEELKSDLVNLFGSLSIGKLFLLALFSSVGEELFFRGGIQPYLGLIPTSIIFGLMHLGPRGGLSAWTLWATFAGLLMGWIFQQTGSIISVFIIHFAVNFSSLLAIRRTWHLQSQEQAHSGSAEPRDKD